MLRVCIAALALAATSCTALVDTDVTPLGPRPVACRMGSTFECTCAGGLRGLQTCNAQGKFNPCRCGPDPGRAGNGG